MNKSRILDLASKLEDYEKQDIAFDMGVWLQPLNWIESKNRLKHTLHTCETVGCIAGWADHYYGNSDPDALSTWNAGQKLLGLTDAQALNLFEPDADTLAGELGLKLGDKEDPYDCITPQIAAKVLRHLAITGEVSWDMDNLQT